MGLLTNSAASEEPAAPDDIDSPVPPAAAPGAPAAPAVPAAPAAPVIPVASPIAVPYIAPLAAAPVAEIQIDDKTIEAQIRSALEEELKAVEQEFTQEAEQQPLAEETSPAPEAPSEEPEAPEPEMDLADRSDFSQMPHREDLSIQSGDPDVTCFNVMQALVEAKADKYIRLFGLCTCNRCRIDVIALSLSNLPAKYMVVDNKNIVPLLSTYEARYNAAIVSQVMSACRKVMERPRHHTPS